MQFGFPQGERDMDRVTDRLQSADTQVARTDGPRRDRRAIIIVLAILAWIPFILIGWLLIGLFR